MRTATLALVALAACDSSPGDRNGLTLNEIRAVSTPDNVVVDADATPALQPLAPGDLAALGAGGCRFVRNGRLLVAASGSIAIARIDGALRHFVPTAPPAETGAFLEDRQLSVSIGRTAPTGTAARIAVTNRRSMVTERWAGDWSCSR